MLTTVRKTAVFFLFYAGAALMRGAGAGFCEPKGWVTMKKICILVLILALLASAAACGGADNTGSQDSSVASSVEFEGVGGDDGDSYCQHTESERQWIHRLPGHFMAYIGRKAAIEYCNETREYGKETKTDEEKENWTLMAYLKASEVTPEEVNALMLADSSYPEFTADVRRRVLIDVFGSDEFDESVVVKTNFDMPFDEDRGVYLVLHGFTFGTEDVFDPAEVGGSAENVLPYNLVAAYGIKYYNEWFAKLEDPKDYTMQNFLKHFSVPVEDFDECLELFFETGWRSYAPIYTEEALNKIRLEVYGEAREWPQPESESSQATTAGGEYIESAVSVDVVSE